MNYTKTELIEKAAKCFNEGETFRAAYEAARFSNKELARMLAIEMTKEYGYTIMYLNELHKDAYETERTKIWDIEDKLEATTTINENNCHLFSKAADLHFIVDCIIRHGKNYHEDLI